MKKSIAIILMVVTVALCLQVFAAEDSNKPAGDTQTQQQNQYRTKGKFSPDANEKAKTRLLREQITQERRKKANPEVLKNIDKKILAMQAEHDKMITELVLIKQTAQSENANKTVELLDSLIARKNKQFRDKIEPLREEKEEITDTIKKRKLHRHIELKELKNRQPDQESNQQTEY
jgi:hypothetical protein